MQPRGLSVTEAYAVADRLPGWLTEDQARCLYDAAAAVPPGSTVVEIGSHHGRSAVMLAAALPPAARLVAVDPFPDDWRYGAAGTEAAFRANLAGAVLADVVDLRVATSAEVRAGWHGALHLVYVDGKHDYWTCRDDLRWSEHVVAGGTVLVHDAFSSLGVTTALVRELATSGTLRYCGRVGSLARLEVARPRLTDRLRVLKELPWWGRNLLVKVLLRLRLAALARALGHHDQADPY
ncbi:class I SAM-dependent methyltransferase [Nocardioides lianchengensis]|uniref:Methyltransferase domain-containing protein n=1 Tax=Nocardioides lianchengensis TaxID=1045774 RepID=A0A1G6QYT6_9ACTN|nr:class I SAM-dependent methyltransferase [Nocardioides lianchengensis]NYG10434.1 putative O-methyltransferase YrrM [Nocardioides lianchengensis]SDC97468.1 Methyltransferase domain-containing protein [Nocardioides lianchengensis]